MDTFSKARMCRGEKSEEEGGGQVYSVLCFGSENLVLEPRSYEDEIIEQTLQGQKRWKDATVPGYCMRTARTGKIHLEKYEVALLD